MEATKHRKCPAGHIWVEVGKNCALLLTHEEYRRGIGRGKAYLRRTEFNQRDEKHRSPGQSSENTFMRYDMEVPSGFEPLNRSFADCSLNHLGTAP